MPTLPPLSRETIQNGAEYPSPWVSTESGVWSRQPATKPAGMVFILPSR